MVPEQADLAATGLTAIRKQAAALSFAPMSLARMTRLTVPDQQQDLEAAGASLAIERDGNVRQLGLPSPVPLVGLGVRVRLVPRPYRSTVVPTLHAGREEHIS